MSSELKNGLSQKGLAEKVFFDDNATYLGNLLECEFGAGVMLWGSCIYGLHSYLILEENGEDPKLVIYKKR